jgi:uncharacterized protein YkwD
VHVTGLRRLLAAAATVAGLGAAGTDAHAALTPLEHDFLAAVNDVRAEQGAPPVRLDPGLERAARAHSVDMVRRRYFAHGDFAGRLARFGASGRRVGENLGWCSTGRDAVAVVVGKWLRSPSHRAVLLRRRFSRIGVGIARGTVAGHEGAVVVTTDYEEG